MFFSQKRIFGKSKFRLEWNTQTWYVNDTKSPTFFWEIIDFFINLNNIQNENENDFEIFDLSINDD